VAWTLEGQPPTGSRIISFVPAPVVLLSYIVPPIASTRSSWPISPVPFRVSPRRRRVAVGPLLR
jgi:hypothetical protein